MRSLVFGLAAALCFSASSGFAQESWQYDPDGIDGPTAAITEGEYVLGGFCDDGDLYFFADFPRQGMPKDEDASIRFKFRKDTPADTNTFNVSVITRGWDRVDNRASVWFPGLVADQWIDEMASAVRDVFIAAETDEETPRLIFERSFSVRGSTAAIRSLKSACGL